MESIPFIIACKRFFNLRPGQGLTDFNNEVKALTKSDRAELAPLLADALGVVVTL